MRWVTRKPPAILIVPTKIAIAPKIVVAESIVPEICSMPPTIMMPLMALVTLIKGVCSAGATFQINCQPTKQARTKTDKCDKKEAGATIPMPNKASPARIVQVVVADPFF